LATLEKKLTEELKEYSESKSVEELTDILEVIYRIAELKGVSQEKLDQKRQKKADECEKFDENLFLLDSTEP